MEKIKNIIERKLLPTDIILNEMLGCEFRQGGELWLHIDDVRDRTISEKLSLLKNGFKILADRLKSDSKFKNIKLLTGTSWIIGKNPKLLERLGFNVTKDVELFKEHLEEYKSKSRTRIRDEFNNLDPGHAYISRDKFVDLYASK